MRCYNFTCLRNVLFFYRFMAPTSTIDSMVGHLHIATTWSTYSRGNTLRGNYGTLYTVPTRQCWGAAWSRPQLPLGIIDLMEQERNPPQRKIGKSKRAGTPIQSQPASKRFAEDAAFVEKITSRLDCMREHFESFYVNSKGGSNPSNTGSNRLSKTHPPPSSCTGPYSCGHANS
jgi:hypothetical protein